MLSFNVYFVYGFACSTCIGYASKLLSGFLGQGMAFFGEDRLATLLCSSERFDLANRGVRQPVQPHSMLDCSYSTSH